MAPRFSVSDFLASVNQTFEYAYPLVEVEGEVASFKVNQGKYVFFDIKDAEGSIGCFMMLFQLRTPIEDGMKVVVSASPKLTQWGKFSLTVKAVRPSGEGSIKKSFELLKAKLDKEGLFAPERKREIAKIPTHIGVISSVQAAGYADFIKILNDRWGGISVDVANVTVQGADAPDQIINAIDYFNSLPELVDILVIIRGGGSADDLSAFNDEKLVRAIATSRTPTVTGIGHEVDESLSDLASDLRAATPSNAAQLITPDKHAMIDSMHDKFQFMVGTIEQRLGNFRSLVQDRFQQAADRAGLAVGEHMNRLGHLRDILHELDPARVLERGYAILRGDVEVGKDIDIETSTVIIKARIQSYDKRH